MTAKLTRVTTAGLQTGLIITTRWNFTIWNGWLTATRGWTNSCPQKKFWRSVDLRVAV